MEIRISERLLSQRISSFDASSEDNKCRDVTVFYYDLFYGNQGSERWGENREMRREIYRECIGIIINFDVDYSHVLSGTSIDYETIVPYCVHKFSEPL
jgi:hypothetical protein